VYTLSVLSGWRVWKAPKGRLRTMALALWGTQLVLNAAWSPLFFGRRRPRRALADLAALGASVSAYAAASYGLDKKAAVMVLPYLGWLGFAGALNEEVVRLNWGR